MKTSFFTSINQIDDSFLEKINPNASVYFSRHLLYGFEASNTAVEVRYVCISKNNTPQALALVQIVDLSIDVILKNIKVSERIRQILNLFFCKDHIKIMFCGNVFLSGEHGISFAPGCDRKLIAVEIGTALDEIAKSIRPLHAIFIKDFQTSALEYTSSFEHFGFNNIKVEPNMMITLKQDWTTFDEYKAALKSKYRVKANKADAKSELLELRVFSQNDIEFYKDELQNLYQNTIDNANFNAQVLDLNTYIKLKNTYKDDFIVQGYFLNDKIVGFLSALVNKKNLDAHFIGLEYDLNKTYAIYPRILNDYIRLGLEKNVESINLGRTASEIKTTIGAEPLELSCYIKHKNKLINRLIQPFFRKIQIKSFKQHSPFK
ncbi:MAG: peptidogalycan biosysnthesis protein [Bacteroidetes bacterium]|nr:peptidogalycan biosysnthesis protein [Bacteroidota bacterium]MDA1175603.1 peptidogalycan biosysnthesis protein [Bacteroidota bacterium]